MASSSARLIALSGVCAPSPISNVPALTAFSHVWMVPSGIPNSLAALAPPISLASLTAWILYSWSYLRWVRDIESSSLFSFIIHEFLENKVSTLFIQHHQLFLHFHPAFHHNNILLYRRINQLCVLVLKQFLFLLHYLS